MWTPQSDAGETQTLDGPLRLWPPPRSRDCCPNRHTRYAVAARGREQRSSLVRMPSGARASLIMIVLGGLALAGPTGPTAPALAASKDPALATKLGKVLSDKRVTKAKTAVAVVDTTLGAEVYGYHATRPTTPASNTKIVTAVTAMHVLGPSYRFKTVAIRRGRVVKGVVQGRLYLKGYGDPTSRVSDYASLARQIKAKGISHFTGRLVVDGSWFDSSRYNPNWSKSYASAYYAAQISALTVAPNADYDSGTVYVKYKPGKKGKKVKITVSPAAAGKILTIDNSASSGGRSNTIKINRKYGTNKIIVSGQVPTGRGTSSVQITVNKP